MGFYSVYACVLLVTKPERPIERQRGKLTEQQTYQEIDQNTDQETGQQTDQ